LLAVSTGTWADDQQNKRNVYDVFRSFGKSPPGTTIDEWVTAQIKRHMANLLYPVDISMFIGPDNDPKFRELIIALQRQMDVPPTVS
jgi:hypothetical protein